VKAAAFCIAAVLPVALGLGLLVFYIDGHLGGATTLLVGFSIAAVSFTAIVFRETPGTGTAEDLAAHSLDNRIDS
jgi:hypothetical protein